MNQVFAHTMCSRFLLEQAQLGALAATLGLPASASTVLAPRDRFNIAPGTPIAALRSLSGAFHPRWGFAPRETGDTSLINARAETLAERPTFRDSFARRRCLVPATGFYEWEKRGRARLPWLFRLRGDTAFCLPGLWEKSAEGVAVVVVITTIANALVAPLHHRMPAIFATAETCLAWLDPRATEHELTALLAQPTEAATMHATPVSPRINRSTFESPECIAPAVHGLSARDEAEDGLGLL